MWLRIKTEWRDRLFYSNTVRRVGSGMTALRAAFSGLQKDGRIRALSQDCAAARLAVGPRRTAHLQQRIRNRAAAIGTVAWERWAPGWKTDRIEKAVVLKPCLGPREKGVVFISFEYQWARLLSLANLQEFAARYTLVVAPSASPPYGVIQSLFPGRFPAPFFSLISNEADREILQAQSNHVSEKLVVVPLYASSWVDPDRFYPDPDLARDIDILMVANFAPVKRHFTLFRALKDMPRERRVTLVGQPDRGFTAQDLRNLAAAYGVADRVEIIDSVTHLEVAALLRRAKVSVVLSRREGACVVVPESLFSGTPVGIFEDAEMGSRAFIGPETGRFLQHENLGPQLENFVASATRYRPREWAMRAGISCYGSTEILNEILKRHSDEAGQDWTTDLAPHAWNFDPVLVRPADFERLKPAYHEIKERFGIRVGTQFND